MPKLTAGVVKFQREVYPDRRAMFETLTQGQKPEALFITCSDSRVDPTMVTQTEPGELFICRNAGNIVPPHTTHTGAMTAAIEYAIGALKVPHIVVCGHSQCGAMTGALNPDSLADLPHTHEWLDYARAAVQIVQTRDRELSQEEKLKRLIEENVILQLTHLRSHPYVAQALAEGTVTLRGWVYDIGTGGMHALDESRRAFVPVDELYSDLPDAQPDNLTTSMAKAVRDAAAGPVGPGGGCCTNTGPGQEVT
ncbi:carbonic anhydrase [Rhodothalassium salexigens DSM 2132]|uniref:Carbonic anhydrase n=1 Tax=Rhodothalassium salexigens DSM 2132 TaxID=1188247 RepID=A0A4R2P8V0_RHOSA|nr:carbonic anhydrase [Rhodothalassium salexigens]MBB4212644.1 carbonic anhydrase [Rhodothalassium salexigens DSM 2132]MBK1638742.1 carbonic anhydrase [Rhodothalassium salexigens DSM 2132]TCP30758.1 carbonic anhydrase [Rhodothalassium salexigens DSM 2132]